MDLTKLSLDELNAILKALPKAIAAKENDVESEAEAAERRKRSLFASLKELADKQGVSL